MLLSHYIIYKQIFGHFDSLIESFGQNERYKLVRFIFFMLHIIFLTFPIASIIFSAWCYLKCFQHEKNNRWIFLLFGSISIIFLCVWFYYILKIGLDIAIILYLITSGLAFISGIYLVFRLPGRKKIISAIMIIGFPLLLTCSVYFGTENILTQRIDINVMQIQYALDEYHYETGLYPEDLNKLPKYVYDYGEVDSQMNWLYSSNGNNYFLGYKIQVGKLWYSVTYVNSSNPNVNIIHNSAGPFKNGMKTSQ